MFFGKNGPLIPEDLNSKGKSLVHHGIGETKFRSESVDDLRMITAFEKWLKSLDKEGYISPPFDWQDTQ